MKMKTIFIEEYEVYWTETLVIYKTKIGFSFKIMLGIGLTV